MAPATAALYLLVMDVAFTHVAGEGRQIIFQQEDATGVVEVFQPAGGRWLVTNRLHAEGSDLPEAVYLQRKQGYLPLLLHPRPESVIEIGLGTGIGFTPVVLDDRVNVAEVVEISPGVVSAASLFSRQNLDVLSDPKLRLRVGDGRNYLLVTPRRYDVIVVGLLTSYQAGVGSLYTREFYQLTRERLRPGGMVVQWLALSELSLETLRTVLATFRSVFPRVYLWDRGYYLAALALDQELQVDFEQFRARLRAPAIREDLERWGLADPYNFLASFVMGPEGVDAFVAGMPINTEDRPRIEFSRVKAFDAAYSLRYAAESLAALLAHRRSPLPWVRNLGERGRQQLERYAVARGFALVGLGWEATGAGDAARRAFLTAVRLNPRDDIAGFALRRPASPPPLRRLPD